jgi:hypothetical protein
MHSESYSHAAIQSAHVVVWACWPATSLCTAMIRLWWLFVVSQCCLMLVLVLSTHHKFIICNAKLKIDYNAYAVPVHPCFSLHM